MNIYKTLSKRKDAINRSQVMCFIQNGHKNRFRIKSGILVPIAYWNEKKKNISIPQKIGKAERDELLNLKDQLDTVEKRICKLIDLYGDVADKLFIESTLKCLKDYDGTITTEIVNKAIMEKEKAIEVEESKKRESVKNIFNHCTEFLKQNFSEGRKRHYKVIFRTMDRYQIYRNKIVKKPFVWNIDTVTREDIEDFFDYIVREPKIRTTARNKKVFESTKTIYPEENKRQHKEVMIQERGENRLIGLRKGIKAYWNWLIKTKKTTNNPFDGVAIGSPKFGTPYFLTIEERNQIADHVFTTSHLTTQRDIFIFQCLIGCRVGDLTKLTPDNIVNDMLVYTPHKTKDGNESFVARIPLNERAKKLVEKYKGVDKKGRLFPFISDQKYNETIKEILTLCDITRMVNVRNPKSGEMEMRPINEIGSSHMARRTFVGNAYKVVKDPNLIGRMSGHVEGSKAFVRYRDIDDDMLKEVINAIK